MDNTTYTDIEKIISEFQNIITNLKIQDKEDNREVDREDKEDIAKLSELLMNYKFHKEMKNANESEEYSQKDMLRFLSLGWYVYSNLITSN